MQAESEAIKDSSLKSAAPIAAARALPKLFFSEIHTKWEMKVCKIFQTALIEGACLTLNLFGDFKIIGRENSIKFKKGPLIIVANHKSYFDPLILGHCFSFYSDILPGRFITSDYFFKNPIWAFFFRYIATFPAFRGHGLEKSLEIPSKVLKNNELLVFFPEATCIRNDDLGEPKIGIGELLIHFPDVLILPVAISGTHKSGWMNIFKRPKVRMNIGKPYRLSEIEGYIHMDRADVLKNVWDKIAKLYREIA